jgi:prophage regulatory protein
MHQVIAQARSAPLDDSNAPGITGFIRLREVLRVTGLGRSTVYRLIAAKDFPAPCRLGARAVGWRRADVAQWSATRPAARS